MTMIKEYDIEELADTILEDIDYDIFKEDLEERVILSGIEDNIVALLTSYDISIEKEED